MCCSGCRRAAGPSRSSIRRRGRRRGCAIPVAAIIGTISPKPQWVSSSTSASPDSGACIPAPIIAAAPTKANPGRGAGPRQRPDDPEARQDRAGRQRRGEQTAGCAAAQAQGRDQRLEREQGEQQAGAADAEERLPRHIHAVAEQLREDAETPSTPKAAAARTAPRARGAVIRHQADQPDVPRRDQPDHRPGQHRPHHHRPGERVVRYPEVDGVSGRYIHAVAVAIPEHAIAGSTTGRVTPPMRISALNSAPASGTS